MAKNIMYDPATATTYTWLVNHTEQDGPGRQRSFQSDARARQGYGVIEVEGDLPPLYLTLKGRILHESQYVAFWDFFDLHNTFHFTDEDGNKYEVTMVSFEPNKRRCFYNPADSNMRRHTWEYTMKLRVYAIISGELLGKVAM